MIAAIAIAAVQACGAAASELRLGEDVRAEIARVLAMTRSERALAIARLRAPRPIGLEEIHPEWRALRFAGEDARVCAIARGAPAADPVRVWAERRLYGHLAAMPAPGEIELPADLARARADWIAHRLERVGLRQLAHATAGAPRVELAALAARLDRRGKAYVEAVTWIRGLGDEAAIGRLGPRRAAQSRCDGLRFTRDRLAFLALGVRAIAPYLTPEIAQEVAQRLPLDLGERVLAEIVPPWTTIAGPSWAEVIESSRG